MINKRFWRFQSTFCILFNTIYTVQAIVYEIVNKEIESFMYWASYSLIFLSYIWIFIYFAIIGDVLTRVQGLNINKNYNEFKSLEKIINGFPFLFNGASIIYNLIFTGICSLLLIIKNSFKWWAILLAIFLILILSFMALVSILFAHAAAKDKKIILKRIKEYEEHNNVQE